MISGAELIARVQAMQGLASVRTDSPGLRRARDALARFASADGFGAAATPSPCAGAASEEAGAGADGEPVPGEEGRAETLWLPPSL
eukprot:COSAG01_NODE_10369_length_2183_cov_1.401152_2_plen_86_part_00